MARTIEDIGDPEFERPPKRARLRYVARYTIVVGLLTAIAGGMHLFTDALPFWYATAALWVFVPPAAHLKWKNIGYAVGEKYVIARVGFWTRRTTIVPYYRVQTVSSAQSIFQRRRDLATLAVDTATSGGFWGGDAIVPDIDAEVAADLREQTHDRFQHSLIDRRSRRPSTRSTYSEQVETGSSAGPEQHAGHAE